MIDSRIELNTNYDVIEIKDFSIVDINDLKDKIKDNQTKIILRISSLDILNQFNNFKIVNLKNVHITLECTKQVFLMLNTIELINNTIIKSIDIDDMKIRLDFYTPEVIPTSILENNMKILERISYISNDMKLHSKNHEILYQANYILKEYKKSEDKLRRIRQNIHSLKDLVDKK